MTSVATVLSCGFRASKEKTPPDNIIAPARSMECEPGCGLCKAAFEKHGKNSNGSINPNFQAIGRKGLYKICKERGVKNPEKILQADLVTLLEEHPDFKPKISEESSLVYEMMEEAGHFAFFGVKYHAELAAIERKWMHMKRMIRGYLNGSLPHLKDLIDLHWSEYSVSTCRKDSRHCRETCRVYRLIGEAPELAMLKDGQKMYKGHRRVFDAATGLLQAAVDPGSLSEKQQFFAERLQTARDNRKVVEERRDRCEREIKAERNRKKYNKQKKKPKKQVVVEREDFII